MADEKTIKLIHKTFNIYGLSITKKLSTIVAKHLQSNPELDPESWLTRVVEQILTQNLTTPQVDIEHIKLAIKECIKPESTLQETETVLNVIDAFTVPKVVYDLNKQKYVIEKADFDLFPDAKHKSLVFKERLDLLWYKTLKHPIFAPSKLGRTDENKLQLVPIEYLLSECKTKNVCIMGLLSQITEGHFYLEDYGGSVKLNLKKASFNSSLVVEGSIVLATGKYSDKVLHVDNIDFPPHEAPDESRVNFGDANVFGGPHPLSLRFSDKLKLFEDSNSANFFVFISEFWVDNEVVLSKFEILLSGFSESPPVAIVLCGHFSNSTSNVASAKKLREGFKKVAGIISRYPLIHQNTKFIIVPGPFDLSAPKILPRAPLPKYIMEDFLKVVPGTYLATNPCRIQYCTKEIVVFRENMLSKLSRNTLCYPKKEIDENGQERGEKVYEAFAKSIIRQSHLTPLLFSTIPVYWKHDHALQLYPTPDLLVVADDFQSYTTKYNECQVTNPGSFVKSNFSFKVYCPKENLVEDCDIPDDTEL
ncbi:DNA polymerase epsilon subunit 2 [Copidosoma floridanum]|uniref:DNA polymerase epsilon subunit 2 n=1 Tax=Copidosoma floridanum TaxID=29053 RepID=UPI0006C9659B|nr:DNA polymerase epsilon subunit 2 [Copidosoma floridanum]